MGVNIVLVVENLEIGSRHQNTNMYNQRLYARPFGTYFTFRDVIHLVRAGATIVCVSTEHAHRTRFHALTSLMPYINICNIIHLSSFQRFGDNF